MSHQSGITASTELLEFFANSKDGHVRLMKIGIEEEKLVLLDSAGPVGTWEHDWDSLILPRLEEKQPCYIFFRLDNCNDSGHEWVYIAYSPDFSQVRQKMLYASTRATLKKEFGGGQVRDEMFGTVPHDINLAGYKKHVVSHHAPKPLTFAEEELEMIKRTEDNVNISVDTKHQTVQGVAFPLSQSAMDKLQNFKDRKVSYVQLSLDLEQEKINLELAENIDIHDLRSKFPKDHARYHFFAFKHTHKEDQLLSNVFIYSMPGYNCSIKERMLYSTCKAPLIDYVEQHLKMEIARKIEIDDGKELTYENLYEEIHPPVNIVKQPFAKPKGPAGRGPKRVTKANGGDD